MKYTTILAGIFLSVSSLYADIQVKNSWDYPPIWEISTDGVSTAGVTLARGKYGNCLEVAYTLKSDGDGWVELKNKTFIAPSENTPVIFLLKAESPSLFEIKFVDDHGSIFSKRLLLKDAYKDWTQIVAYSNNLEFKWGKDREFHRLKEVRFAVTGKGDGKIWLDEIGFGKAGTKATLPPAGPQLDPNRTKGGFEFESRRSQEVISEDPLVTEWLNQIQDGASPDKALLPTTEDNNAGTYTNALAALVFILKDERSRAERILDFYAASTLKENADPSLQNFYLNGETRGFFQNIILTTTTIPAYHQPGTSDRSIGDMAWLLLACTYYEKTYHVQKYSALASLLKELIISYYKSDASGGFIQSGWKNGDSKLHDREGNPRDNIVCYAALKLCGDTSHCTGVKKWLDASLNDNNNLPLNLYTLRVLSFGKKYGDLLSIPDYDLRYRCVLRQNMKNIMGIYPTPEALFKNSWLEGVGQLADAYYASGNVERGNFYADQIDPFIIKNNVNDVPTALLPLAANNQGMFEGVDLKKGSVPAAAWYIFAKNQFNPLTLARSPLKIAVIKKSVIQPDYLFTASSYENENSRPEFCMDDNLKTCWSSQFSDPQWLQIEIKKPRELCGLTLHWGASYAKSYDLLLSVDGKTWKAAYATTDGDGGTDEIYFPLQQVRFIQLLGKERTTYSGYSLCEVELKGKDEVPTLKASSSATPPQAALDGSKSTSWLCKKGGNQWLEVDFPKVKEYGGLEIEWGGHYAVSYELLVSTNARNWHKLYTTTSGNGKRDMIYFEQTPLKYVKLNLLNGVDNQGYEIREITFKGPDESATPLKYYELAASEAPLGFYPRWLYKQQEYWTITGVDSNHNESLLSEDGDIEPYQRSFSLNPFLFIDNKLISYGQVSPQQSLEKGYLPLPSVTWNCGNLQMNIKAFSSGSADNSGTYAWYTLENKSSSTVAGKLLVAIRPFQINPPWQFGGLSEINTMRYITATSTVPASVIVNGRTALISLSAPEDFGTQLFKEGDVIDTIARGSIPKEKVLFDDRNFASGVLVYDIFLQPGAKKDIVLLLPFPLDSSEDLIPQPGNNLAAFVNKRYQDMILFWDTKLARAKITLGDNLLVNTLKSNLAYILINRDEEQLLGGPCNYHKSWTRTGAEECAALLRLGYNKEVKEYINWLSSMQEENGRIPFLVEIDKTPDWASTWNEYDSQGQFVDTVMEYYRFTGDTDFLTYRFPSVVKALQYLESLRKQQLFDEFKNGAERKRALYGILPESNSHELYFPAQHGYWDNFWALKGWNDGIEMARILEKKESVAWMAHEAEALSSSLYTSLDIITKMKQIDYLPGCVEKGDFDPETAAIALYPCNEFTKLPQPQTEQTLKKYFDEIFSRQNSAAWKGSCLTHELRIGEAFLRLGEVAKAQTLLHFFVSAMKPLSWNVLTEVVYSDYRHPQFIGDMPHSGGGAELITLMRDSLVREEGNRLILGQGIETKWIQSPGVSVKSLPTYFGQVSYQIAGDTSTVKIDVSGTAKPAGGFVLKVPEDIPVNSIEINGKAVPGKPTHDIVFPSLPARIILH